MSNLFMQEIAELENQYNIDKQALREAREEIYKAEAFAIKHNASALVSVYNGRVTVWVQVSRKLFTMFVVENGILLEKTIAGKNAYIIDGVKAVAR